MDIWAPKILTWTKSAQCSGSQKGWEKRPRQGRHWCPCSPGTSQSAPARPCGFATSLHLVWVLLWIEKPQCEEVKWTSECPGLQFSSATWVQVIMPSPLLWFVSYQLSNADEENHLESRSWWIGGVWSGSHVPSGHGWVSIRKWMGTSALDTVFCDSQACRKVKVEKYHAKPWCIL